VKFFEELFKKNKKLHSIVRRRNICYTQPTLTKPF
jgi:hypothetical protein